MTAPHSDQPERLGEPKPFMRRGSMQPPPSPMTQEKRVAAAEVNGHGHHHAKPSRGFYRPAHRLLEWGQVQTGMHASWGDLLCARAPATAT